MKRFISVFLIVLSVLTSFGCKEKTKDIKITKDNNENIITKSINSNSEQNIKENSTEESTESKKEKDFSLKDLFNKKKSLIKLDRNNKKIAILQKKNIEGNNIINLMNGKVEIRDGYNTATGNGYNYSAISPNRNYIVSYCRYSKDIVCTDIKKNKDILVTDNGGMAYITDMGIWYEDADFYEHRYLFSDSSDVICGHTYQFRLTSINSNFVQCIDEDDKNIIYLLKQDSTERQKISEVENKFMFLYLSEDANTIIWADYENHDAKIYMYKDGEKNLIGSLDIDDVKNDEYVRIKRNGNEDSFILYNKECEYFYILPKNGEPIKVNSSGKIGDSDFFTENCNFDYDASEDFNGLYFTKEEDSFSSETVYYVDTNGQVNNVLSVSFMYGVYDGYIYYRDTNMNLVVAKIDGASISEKETITAEIQSVNSMKADGSLYYTKDFIARDDLGHDLLNTVDLYVYKRGSSPIKVASEISGYLIYPIGYNAYLTDNADEDTVYFYKDVVYHDNLELTGVEGHYTGTLYKYSYGDDEPTKIASNVVLGTITSGLASGKIDNNSFTYIQYTDIYNNRIIGDWCYYNGKESVKMAENIYA